MSAPIRPGDYAVIHSPVVVVEEVTEGLAMVLADGLIAQVPVEWLVPVRDVPGGGGR